MPIRNVIQFWIAEGQWTELETLQSAQKCISNGRNTKQIRKGSNGFFTENFKVLLDFCMWRPLLLLLNCPVFSLREKYHLTPMTNSNLFTVSDLDRRILICLRYKIKGFDHSKLSKRILIITELIKLMREAISNKYIPHILYWEYTQTVTYMPSNFNHIF